MMKLAKRPKPAKIRSYNKPPIKVILKSYEKYLLLFIKIDAGTISPQECVHGNDASEREPRVVEPQSISCRLLNGSDQSVPNHWQMAQTEIFQCQADHACFPIGEVELPTRLVDLSNHANNLITIKNTAEVGKNIKYAALSYCWGKSNTFTITSATLADRQQGFSPSALPLSLQDALRVAQGLHMQYIWIDALCILQDSDEDWLYESARMASIYKNSFITIVAANAPDSDDGFFSIAAHQCQIPVKPSHEDTQNTSVILDTSVQFKDEPISRRAWALQEWELAPRRLLFTSSRIHYICPHSSLDKIKMKPFFPMSLLGGPMAEAAGEKFALAAGRGTRYFLAQISEIPTREMGGSVMVMGIRARIR
ncbi:HET domain-containing protein [Colletotrichum tamarilloi]|uniref:HET domain-containing protein n=1 Tax=Colletotrichum tamarilloi TaxID=1209934 RepID=A0ABQ9R755_9PEZI|nr:HET domain-containing protein [Colletotrichum tamarilloi]KAK1497058.1 HET domain-containing protein [Colletotrichum tamarilloi]